MRKIFTFMFLIAGFTTGFAQTNSFYKHQYYNGSGNAKGKNNHSLDKFYAFQKYDRAHDTYPFGYHSPGTGSTCGVTYLNDQAYSKLIWGLNNQHWDQQKKQYLYSAYSGSLLSCQQALGLLSLFQLEASRLEVLNFLYPYLWDRQNLGLLEHAFQTPHFKNQFYALVNQNSCNGHTGFPGYPAPPHHQPMPYRFFSDAEFDAFKGSIQRQSFSSDKMIILKQGSRGRMIPSGQVLELVQIFNFESDKLEAAKFLYNLTYDKENFYLVNNAFSFSSSVRELNKYVMSQH